jgi:hypothetical protein
MVFSSETGAGQHQPEQGGGDTGMDQQTVHVAPRMSENGS